MLSSSPVFRVFAIIIALIRRLVTLKSNERNGIAASAVVVIELAKKSKKY